MSLKQRVTVMRKMVDLASELWMRGLVKRKKDRKRKISDLNRDFQSSMSVVSALQSAAIARLRLTWKGLSQACKQCCVKRWCECFSCCEKRFEKV